MSISNFFHLFGKLGGDVENIFAPGRITLMGDHTDYNGGSTLTYASKQGTTVLIRKRLEDNMARFASSNFPGIIKISLDEPIAFNPEHKWANYAKGIVRMIQNSGRTVTGFDVLFSGNVANEAGLASSASMQIALATALNNMFKFNFSAMDLAKLSYKAKTQFSRVHSELSAPAAIALAQEDHALLLQCQSFASQLVPLNIEKNVLFLMDTNKRLGANEPLLQERRNECAKALVTLQAAGADIKHLSDLTTASFTALSQHLDDTLRRRVNHVVTENHRVNQAVTVLNAGNAKILGMLLNASHASLRDDFEVSCHELNTIVEEAIKNPACLGARMMGTGFGGCAIALVDKRKAEDFKHVVSTEYEKIIGVAPSLYY